MAGYPYCCCDGEELLCRTEEFDEDFEDELDDSWSLSSGLESHFSLDSGKLRLSVEDGILAPDGISAFTCFERSIFDGEFTVTLSASIYADTITSGDFGLGIGFRFNDSAPSQPNPAQTQSITFSRIIEDGAHAGWSISGGIFDTGAGGADGDILEMVISGEDQVFDSIVFKINGATVHTKTTGLGGFTDDYFSVGTWGIKLFDGNADEYLEWGYLNVDIA